MSTSWIHCLVLTIRDLAGTTVVLATAILILSCGQSNIHSLPYPILIQTSLDILAHTCMSLFSTTTMRNIHIVKLREIHISEVCNWLVDGYAESNKSTEERLIAMILHGKELPCCGYGMSSFATFHTHEDVHK